MNKELEIKHTKVLTDILNNQNKRFLFLQGGSRSSKTYSTLQYLIIKCLTEENIIVNIIRKNRAQLTKHTIKDFIDILNIIKLYDDNMFNKTNLIYKFNNKSIIRFIGGEDPEKLRGIKSTYVYINEGTELSQESFMQINIRCEKQLLIDFNPSEEFWMKDYINRPDAVLLHSTYKDNSFLKKQQIEEIEYLINVDENYYKVYALGIPPIPTTRIYSHFKSYNNLPNNIKEIIYGLDFGYNHATALVKTYHTEDNKIYVEEIIYQSNLTTPDLITLLKEYNIEKHIEIYADGARPEIIEDIRRSGYNIKAAKKNVKEGIDYIKSKEIFIHNNSINLFTEAKKYSWKTYKDIIMDEPIKLYDDALDAMRYAIYSNKQNNNNISFYNTKNNYYEDDYLGHNFV